MKQSRTIYGLILALILGALVGWLSRGAYHVDSGLPPVRADLETYKFVNPLIMSASDDAKSPQLSDIVRKTDEVIASAKKAGILSDASVYLRDMNSGRWTGVNEDQTYTPSSMLKVVTMVAVLKLAEQDPTIIDKKLAYIPDDSTRFYRPNDDVRAGQYPVKDLIYNMIVYSDNAANAALLKDKWINDSFNLVYSLVRLPRNASTTPDDPDFMSVKSFSSVFRVLYNSTLFQWPLSEQALDLLSQTKFIDGLVAGVPTGTQVSHKFGEAAFVGDRGATVHELHDCGIIYFPKHPYFLCVMTRGSDTKDLKPVIADISKLVWAFWDEKN